MLAYRRAATKTGVETSVALAMANDQAVDWDKASTARVDKAAMGGFLMEAKKYSIKLLHKIDPSSAPSPSTTQTEVQ